MVDRSWVCCNQRVRVLWVAHKFGVAASSPNKRTGPTNQADLIWYVGPSSLAHAVYLAPVSASKIPLSWPHIQEAAGGTANPGSSRRRRHHVCTTASTTTAAQKDRRVGEMSDMSEERRVSSVSAINPQGTHFITEAAERPVIARHGVLVMPYNAVAVAVAQI